MQDHFNSTATIASLSLGVITLIVGVSGTILGSPLLTNTMAASKTALISLEISQETYDNILTYKACIIMIIFFILVLICTLTGTLIDKFVTFLIALALGEFFAFITIVPWALAAMCCVSTNLRSQARAISLFVSYAIGGFPSPSIIGAIFDKSGEKTGIIIGFAWIIWAVIFSLIAWGFSVIYI